MRERVEELLLEARELGVKEFYFTGGEPMLHPEFFELAERTLLEGPLSVLTNGILIDGPAAGGDFIVPGAGSSIVWKLSFHV